MEKNNISDDEIIALVTNRIREREKKVKELEFMFAEMENMNKKLLHLEESKSNFLSLIRNEFNNPLFGIVPIIENLLHKYIQKNEDKEDIEALEMIYTEIGRTNFQLNNIISAAEIENDVIEKNITEFDLLFLINDIVKSLEFIYSEKRLHLKEDIKVEVIRNDREKIYVILNNILDNAFKFSKNNNDVGLEIYEKENFIHILVSNTGDELDKESIMESFYEGEMNNSSREKRGLGLGNNLINVYVEFLGGKFEVSRKEQKNIIEIKLPNYADSSEDIFGCDLDEFDFGDFDDNEEVF